MRLIHVGEDTELDSDRPLVGAPESIIDDIETYAGAGCTRLLVNFFTPDLDAQMEQILRFGREVLPSF